MGETAENKEIFMEILDPVLQGKVFNLKERNRHISYYEELYWSHFGYPHGSKSIPSFISCENQSEVSYLQGKLEACKEHHEGFKDFQLQNELELMLEKLKMARKVKKMFSSYISEESVLLYALQFLMNEWKSQPENEEFKFEDLKLELENLLHDKVTQVWSEENVLASEENSSDHYFDVRKQFFEWKDEYLRTVLETDSLVNNLASYFVELGSILRNLISEERDEKIVPSCSISDYIEAISSSLCSEETLWGKVTLVPMILRHTLRELESVASGLTPQDKKDLSPALAEGGDSVEDDRSESGEKTLSLLNFIRISGRMNPEAKTLIALDLIKEVQNLHENGKTYLYITPANILLKGNKATLCPMKDMLHHEPIPPFTFLAPEVRSCHDFPNQSIKWGHPADSYSLGKVILWLACVDAHDFPETMNAIERRASLVTGLMSVDALRRTSVLDLITEELETSLREIFEKNKEDKTPWRDERTSLEEPSAWTEDEDEGRMAVGESISSGKGLLWELNLKRRIEKDEENILKEMEDTSDEDDNVEIEGQMEGDLVPIKEENDEVEEGLRASPLIARTK